MIGRPDAIAFLPSRMPPAPSILITGGAGFIGSHLAAGFRAGGAEVRVLDDLSTGNRANVPDDVEFIEGCVTNPDIVTEAMDGMDIAFHLAAVVSVSESVTDPSRCHEVNASGTGHVLEAARTTGTRRVVLASTCAIYGDEPALPSRETDTPDCRSPYAASKAAAEGLMAAYAHCYGLSTVSLRFFNIFGPRQDPSSPYAAVVSAFHDALSSGRPVRIDGDGGQTRDFTPVANVVHACRLASDESTPLTGQVLNVGTGVQTSVRELLDQLAAILGVTPDIQNAPARIGDVRDSCANLDRTRDVLGYEPVADLAAGLAELTK